MNQHIPVLLHESIRELDIREGETVLDATLGGGGHSRAICEMLGKGTLVAIDEDPDAFERSAENLSEGACKTVLIHGNFRNAETLLREKGIEEIDKALFDLGISSFHLESSGRGFSFQRKEPLLMTLGKTTKRTAFEIVNSWREEDLVRIIRDYGEEGFARRIAHGIVEARKTKLISDSEELASLIERLLPGWRSKRIHPATKTFQAIRIAVNDEVEALTEGLASVWNLLRPEGRMAVISFHSIEDRIVKNFFRNKKHEEKGELITRKPIVPTNEEIGMNPRSRSAKLRVVQKIA